MLYMRIFFLPSANSQFCFVLARKLISWIRIRPYKPCTAQPEAYTPSARDHRPWRRACNRRARISLLCRRSMARVECQLCSVGARSLVFRGTMERTLGFSTGLGVGVWVLEEPDQSRDSQLLSLSLFLCHGKEMIGFVLGGQDCDISNQHENQDDILNWFEQAASEYDVR